MSGEGARFHVLHVCTGNIGRSPMAERLMREHLRRVLGDAATTFRVDSAGTWGHDGSPMEPFAAVALSGLGADPTGFAARELTEALLADADLVLTATAEHRTTVVGLLPTAMRRTFTLREFARLAGPAGPAPLAPERSDPDPDVDPDPDLQRARLVASAHRAVTEAWAARGRLGPPASAVDDDVADPIGAPADFYRDRAAEIDSACARAVRGLIARRR